MNLQQLEYFKVIAETKNFTEASNILSVTQPALSKAISKLEEELDVKLFQREGRNIKITKFGDAFLKYAKEALNEIERGKLKLKEMKNNNDMIISISSTNCIGATYIPFLISSFFNHNLKVKFNMDNQSTEEIIKGLKNGNIDFGFISHIEDLDKDIESVLVKNEEYVLIVPRNHRLANEEEVYLKDLKNEYFIAYNNKSSDMSKSYSDLIGYTPKIYAEPSHSSILSGLVAAGAGIAIILNTPMINTTKISVIKIKDDLGYKSIYMAWNKNLPMSENKIDFKNYALNMNEN